MTERELTTEKAAIAQQPVISIRISEALRLKLEGLKVLMSMKSGEPVSTSEAAKQLLESSKEERLELVSLLTEPTDSLLNDSPKGRLKAPAFASRMDRRCLFLSARSGEICQHRTDGDFI